MPLSVNTNNPAAETSNFALHPLAAAMSVALAASATPLATHAQATAATAQTEPKQLSKLVAQDTEEEIKVDAVASPKFTQPLLDTPQTITVVTQEVLRQQGASTLMEALANTPGITMQLGENGNTSAGDAFSMRGSAGQTNVFLDGIRDLGAITRDTFNTQQVEIAKGAVGADYGRGATSGYINMVSKMPLADDFGAAIFSANSGVTGRATGDLNKQFGDNGAFRLNVMWQDGDVVGRDFVTNSRWGVAPSVAFGLNTATRFYLYAQHVSADNVPDGGIPSIGLPGYYNATLAAAGVQPAPVDSENYYGRYDDFEATAADMGTLRIEHNFNDTTILINSTRYGESDIERVLTGINATAFPSVTNPSTWTVARNRQSTAQENKLLTNQTNLNLSFTTGIVGHDLASGIEFIKEEQYAPTYAGLGTLPNANLYNPNAYDAFTVPYARAATGAYSDGETTTYAAYAFDTLSFGEQWLLNGGLRYERYETDYESYNPTATPPRTNLNKSDNLTSWKVGVVYKPMPVGSVYLAYSNSLTPPGSDNFALSATDTNINNPKFDPQEAINIEVGTKWDLLDARLALNAALYRTDNENQLVILDNVTNEYVQYGKRRVQGAELGAVGKLTDRLSVIAGLACSDNEQVEGSATGNNARGAGARWAPEYSGNLWATYSAIKWSAGLGANYVSEQERVVDPSTPVNTQTVPSIPGYTVFNGMFSYYINDSIGLQLNVYNLFDKDYISALNNSGARLRLSTPRYAQLTANIKF